MFGNLYNIAASVIPQQQAQWFRFKSRETDNLGKWASEFWPAVTLTGSWQAVDTQDAQEMGLDVSKVYRRFYTSNDIGAIQRGESPDFLVVDGVKYDVMGDADWYRQDGWKSVICIAAGAHDG